MPPIVKFFDYIFKNYFNEFLQYDHTKQLQLPWWLYSLVVIFVAACVLWLILFIYGLKFLIHRYLINGSFGIDEKPNKSEYTFGLPGNTFTSVQSDNTDDGNHAWVHIRTKQPTLQVESHEHRKLE